MKHNKTKREKPIKTYKMTITYELYKSGTRGLKYGRAGKQNEKYEEIIKKWLAQSYLMDMLNKE